VGARFHAPSSGDALEPETGGTDRTENASYRRARSRKALVGTAVHAVLARARVPEILEDRIPPALVETCAAEQGISDPATVAEVLRLSRAARTPEVLALLASATRVRREVPYKSFEDGVLVEGVIDCLVETPDRAVVLDWKTDDIAPSGREAREKIYRERMDRYAAAAAAALGGRPVESNLIFLR